MTPYEEELLVKCLTHLNVLGDEGDCADFEAWHEAVRYAQSPQAPRDLEDSAELRYQEVLDAPRSSTGCTQPRINSRKQIADGGPDDQQKFAPGPLQARGQAQQIRP